MKSQGITLDSAETKKVLLAFNELHHYKSLDTLHREQIENMAQSIALYQISLETCEKQADNYELIIEGKDDELIETKKALNQEVKRSKLFSTIAKVSTALIPVFFVLGKVL
jgi:uncharacterized membrane protein